MATDQSVSTINLFEHLFVPFNELPINPEHEAEFVKDLEKVLDIAWSERHRFLPNANLYYQNNSTTQRFLSLEAGGVRARNWIGTIAFVSSGQSYRLNFLPKMFATEQSRITSNFIKSIFLHILWWLSEIDREFPMIEASQDAVESDLLEMLASVFSKLCLEVYGNGAFVAYEERQLEISTVRGGIEARYYAVNLLSGRAHILPCRFDEISINNRLNRIVKYVATLLVGQVSLSKTQKELDELLFLLDEVELKVMTLEDCDGLAFNPIQEDIKRVLDLCRLFLSGSSCFTNTEDFEAFAFIVPSEKVFEQFLFSILEQSRGTFIENVRKGVPGRQFLAKEMPVGRDRFKMENDIVVELSIGRTVILDAKYKNLRASNSPSLRLTPDETVGVSQTDIYQMVSYAVGSGVRNLGLIYPKFAASHDERKCLSYRVKNALDESLIRIRGVEIDITSPKIDVGGPSCSLQELFQETKKRVSEDLVLIVHKVAEEGDRSPWDQLG